jgi:hypothetical protein
VGKAIYAIDAFPDDAQLWRIDWIGGVAYNASVPSEPLIDVCLARLPERLLSIGSPPWRPARRAVNIRPIAQKRRMASKDGINALAYSKNKDTAANPTK